MGKTKNYKSKNQKKSNRTLKKHSKRGGKKRSEKIIVTLGREHTTPDIVSVISVDKGPNTYDTNSQGEYLVNFISECDKRFEEELAVLKGPPTSKTKTKEYEYIYDDSDVALEPGLKHLLNANEKQKTKIKNNTLIYNGKNIQKERSQKQIYEKKKRRRYF